MSTIDLDDVAFRRTADPGEMGRRISELPLQCREARLLAQECSLPAGYGQADAIVILGLGGSAVGGDLVRTLVDRECPVPILLNRDYDLPAFVNDRTLVIASSYSGNTEETLRAFGQALERDAIPLAITTGGKLAEICKTRGLPLITFEYESQPRAALGYSLVTLLVVLQRLGLSTGTWEQLDEAILHVEQLGALIGVESPEKNNSAKQLARRLEGKLPVIYGASHLSEVARRWKCQLNENSKAWAFWETIPEANHNAVVGYDFPGSLTPHVHVLMLSSDLYEPRHRVRLDVTAEILTDKGISHETIHAQGKSRLAQVLWVIHLCDYVSYYLAALHGVDPTPVKTIAYLKERLAQVQ
jgi:glucose/mannose-6-phosphate isomerase